MDLSPRLERILFHIPTVQILADVGTDHGQVILEAVDRKKVQLGIGIDKSPESLEKAKVAAAERRLTGKVSLRLGEGLQPLRTGEAQCIVIAGLGGQQMVKMLEATGPLWANARLILQPNKDVYAVRRFLFDEGVVLSTESLVVERGRYYTILVAQRGPAHMRDMAYNMSSWYPADLHYVGPHLLREGGANVAALYEKDLATAKSELKKMPLTHERRPEYEARRDAIERALAAVKR